MANHTPRIALRTPRHSAAFTLIELLVAISILAIIAVLGWRSLDSLVRTKIALTAEIRQSRGLQLTFAQLQSDCEHAAVVTNIGGRQTLAADQEHLTLVRIVYAENQVSRYQVVSYRIREGVLTRRESPAISNLVELDTIWESMKADTDLNTPVMLRSDVASMVVQVWSASNPGWNVVAGGGSGTTPIIAIGLQIALQLRGREANMVKSFLLGAA
jgi:general secretion pathway protein J